MTGPATPTCRRCGADLVGAYTTQLVTAHQQRLETGPDGTSLASVLAATSACSWNCLAVLAAQLAGPDADAAVLVVAERERQVTAEGYTPEHDTDHQPGQLAQAGIAYAWDHASEPGGKEWKIRHGYDGTVVGFPPECWPWDDDWWKPKSIQRDLVRAGALIAAEVDAHHRRAR